MDFRARRYVMRVIDRSRFLAVDLLELSAHGDRVLIHIHVGADCFPVVLDWITRTAERTSKAVPA